MFAASTDDLNGKGHHTFTRTWAVQTQGSFVISRESRGYLKLGDIYPKLLATHTAPSGTVGHTTRVSNPFTQRRRKLRRQGKVQQPPLGSHVLCRAQPASAYARPPSTWTPAWPFFAFRVIRDAVIASDE